jgi:AcrR family transcriptional regulator
MQGVAPAVGRKERDRPARKPRRPLRRTLLDDKSSKRTQRSLATSERILDAAEELFAKHGIYGVTMREIAELANVDTALLHYYFESKRGVFDAVFTRRADILNSERMREMDRLEAEPGPHDLEAVIAAYLRPMFRLNRQGGQGWRHYCAFVGNMGSAPELATIYAEKFDPVIRRFFGLMRQAIPEASETDLYWAYHMFSGSIMIVNMANGAIEHLSDGLCHAEDFDEIEPRLVRYTAEGFRSICCRATQMRAA